MAVLVCCQHCAYPSNSPLSAAISDLDSAFCFLAPPLPTLLAAPLPPAPQVAGLDVGWGQQLDMAPDPAFAHRFLLRRALPPGTYSFKFVMVGVSDVQLVADVVAGLWFSPPACGLPIMPAGGPGMSIIGCCSDAQGATACTAS